jgi:hypothetical protein
MKNEQIKQKSKSRFFGSSIVNCSYLYYSVNSQAVPVIQTYH